MDVRDDDETSIGSSVSSESDETLPSAEPEPELARILHQTYDTCKETHSWSSWDTVFERERTNDSGTLREQLRDCCEHAIVTLLRNMMATSTFPRFQLNPAIDDLLPPSMPLPQFTAVYSALYHARQIPFGLADRNIQFKTWRVKDVYAALNRPASFVVARETPGAIYLTYAGASRTDETIEDDTVTHVLINAQLGPYSLSDILRSRRCYWESGHPSLDLATAMKQVYHPVSKDGNNVSADSKVFGSDAASGDGSLDESAAAVVEASSGGSAAAAGDDSSGASAAAAADDSLGAPSADPKVNNSWKSDMATVDASIKFIYLSVKHMSDRYKIENMHLVTPTLTNMDSSNDESEPDSIPELSVGIAAIVAQTYVRWKAESFHAGHTLSDLYMHHNVSLDREYETYCDQNARPEWIDDTMFMRNMQVQERMLALAGLMARRYQSSPRTFASNMRATAKANVKPMDVDETIRTLSQLDLRRGAGSYSSILRVPRSEVEPAYELSRLPVLSLTWSTFFKALPSLRGKLEPHRH